jgi:hypothetical protein
MLELVQTIKDAMGFGEVGTEDNPFVTEDCQQLINIIKSSIVSNEPETLILDVLATVHDDWVTSNDKKFDKEGREGKKYQHFPIEMIGWKETVNDLIFVKPMLEFLGIELDMDKLQTAYQQRVQKFMLDNEFVEKNGQVNIEKMTQAIMRGQDFYSALTENNTATNIVEARQVCEQSIEKSQAGPVME